MSNLSNFETQTIPQVGDSASQPEQELDPQTVGETQQETGLELAVKQAQEAINGISSLVDLNAHAEQLVSSVQNDPELRDQIRDMLQKRRKSLESDLRSEIYDQLRQADLATLNGALSIDAIRKSFIEAGMNEEEAEQSVITVQYTYDKYKKALEDQN